MKERSKVVISRNWNNPEIQMKVDVDGISMEISLADYLDALIIEIGSVATTFTKNGLRKQVIDANGKVIKKIKKESTSIMTLQQQ